MLPCSGMKQAPLRLVEATHLSVTSACDATFANRTGRFPKDRALPDAVPEPALVPLDHWQPVQGAGTVSEEQLWQQHHPLLPDKLVDENSCHSGMLVIATSVLCLVCGKAERPGTVCASVSLCKMRVLQDPVRGSFLQFVILLKSSNTKDFTENEKILIFYCKNLKNQISAAGVACT